MIVFAQKEKSLTAVKGLFHSQHTVKDQILQQYSWGEHIISGIMQAVHGPWLVMHKMETLRQVSKQSAVVFINGKKVEGQPRSEGRWPSTMGSGNVVHIQKGEITERDMYAIASIVGISDTCNHAKRPKMKTGFLDAMLFLWEQGLQLSSHRAYVTQCCCAMGETNRN